MASYMMSPKPLYPIDIIQIMAVLITKKQYLGFLSVVSGAAIEAQFLSMNNV